MSFFPRASLISEPVSSFSPLFEFLDDFNKHQVASGKTHGRHSGLMKTFSPKFDVKEVGDVYELHGELPGVDQKDIEIEFTDTQTLHIKGRTERTYTQGTPPTGFIEEHKSQGAISHKATVEDVDETSTPAPASETAVTKSDHGNKQIEKKGPETKYWVSERSVGEFSRSFSFPVRVDQDAVKASMKNGVLTIVVPKAKKAASRKITIA